MPYWRNFWYEDSQALHLWQRLLVRAIYEEYVADSEKFVTEMK